jgi:hypothetical protein
LLIFLVLLERHHLFLELRILRNGEQAAQEGRRGYGDRFACLH